MAQDPLNSAFGNSAEDLPEKVPSGVDLSDLEVDLDGLDLEGISFDEEVEQANPDIPLTPGQQAEAAVQDDLDNSSSVSLGIPSNLDELKTRFMAGLATGDVNEKASILDAQKEFLNLDSVQVVDGQVVLERNGKFTPLDSDSFELVSDIVLDNSREIIEIVTDLAIDTGASGVLKTLAAKTGLIGAVASEAIKGGLSGAGAGIAGQKLFESLGGQTSPDRDVTQETLISGGLGVAVPVGASAIVKSKMVQSAVKGVQDRLSAGKATRAEARKLSGDNMTVDHIEDSIARAQTNIDELRKVGIDVQTKPDGSKVVIFPGETSSAIEAQAFDKAIKSNPAVAQMFRDKGELFEQASQDIVKKVMNANGKGFIPLENIPDISKQMQKFEGEEVGRYRNLITEAIAKNRKRDLPMETPNIEKSLNDVTEGIFGENMDQILADPKRIKFTKKGDQSYFTFTNDDIIEKFGVSPSMAASIKTKMNSISASLASNDGKRRTKDLLKTYDATRELIDLISSDPVVKKKFMSNSGRTYSKLVELKNSILDDTDANLEKLIGEPGSGLFQKLQSSRKRYSEVRKAQDNLGKVLDDEIGQAALAQKIIGSKTNRVKNMKALNALLKERNPEALNGIKGYWIEDVFGKSRTSRSGDFNDVGDLDPGKLRNKLNSYEPEFVEMMLEGTGMKRENLFQLASLMDGLKRSPKGQNPEALSKRANWVTNFFKVGSFIPGIRSIVGGTGASQRADMTQQVLAQFSTKEINDFLANGGTELIKKRMNVKDEAFIDRFADLLMSKYRFAAEKVRKDAAQAKAVGRQGIRMGSRENESEVQGRGN